MSTGVSQPTGFLLSGAFGIIRRANDKQKFRRQEDKKLSVSLTREKEKRTLLIFCPCDLLYFPIAASGCRRF